MKSFKTYILEKEHNLEGWSKFVADSEELAAAVDLLNHIEQLGGEAYIVGGAVRDLLMGSVPHDVDIATNIPAEKIREIFKTNELGRSAEFGIVIVHWKGFQFEVAQFRADSDESSDSRHPDAVNFVSSFEKDAARRDFTFNAMGINSKGTIVDYFGGVDDLKNKVVRTVGAAKQRFTEDSLRMLRALRFAAKLGFEIEPATKQAIEELKDTINNVSFERVRDEMIKAAGSGNSLAAYVKHLDSTGLLKITLPEIEALKDFKHNPVHHPEGHVYEHVLAAVEASRSSDPVTNLAILFHDVGKAVTLGTKNGQPTYYGHEAAGEPIVRKIAERLRFPNDTTEAIVFATVNHMKGHNIDKMNDKSVLSLRQNKHWSSLVDTMHADEASRLHLFDPKAFQAKLDHIEAVFRKFGDSQEFEAKMSKLINGKLIMDTLPGTQGKDIGRIKNTVRDWIISREFNVTPAEVIQAIIKAA